MATQVQALVNYYAREGFYRHIQTVCNEVLKKRANEPVQLFWRAYSLILEGTYSEALRELRPLVTQGGEVELAAVAASIHAHRLAKIVDEEAVSELEQRLANEERSASERKLLHTAMFFWHTGSVEKAKGMIERVMRIQPNYIQAKTLLGWIELTPSSADDEDEYMHAVRAALRIFDEVLSGEGAQQRELEAMLGKAKCLEKIGNLPEALNMLNYVVVQFSWFVPALEEKARLLIMVGDWEQAVEVAQRVLATDNQNIEALKTTVLYLMLRESKMAVAIKTIGDLLESLDRNEPKNAELYYRVSQPIARLSGSNVPVLKLSMMLMDRARKLAPESCTYVCEFAYQQMLTGDYASALASYRAASQLDELNTSSMYGTIHCQLLDGQLEDAAGQLDFLSEVSASVDNPVEVTFMQALLAWKRDRDRVSCLRLLDDALRAHLGALQPRPHNVSYYVDLNPQMLLDMAHLYFQQCGSEPRQPTEPPNPAMRCALQVLEALGKAAPGMLEGQLLLARARYIGGDLDGATRSLSHILHMDSTYPQAHIMMAQIYLHQNKPKMAAQSLDMAAAQDFKARETPAYVIVKAKVCMMDGDDDQALQVLESGMQIPGVRRLAPGVLPPGRGAVDVALSERVSIYLLLAECRSKLGKIPEATKIIQDALNEFAGTPEEVRVTVSNCELALNRGDIEGGLSMLRAIPKESPHYVKAKMAMADIYLRHRNDKAMYASCYMDLVEKYPDVQTYMMLGEAFMQIQEPEKAIKAFENALNRQDRKDPTLASKIGRALITTHDYQKAVDYYEKAVKSDPSKLQMQHELADLYYKLRRYDHSERVLNDALDIPKDHDMVDSLIQDVQSMMLLAKVRKGSGDTQGFLDSQQRAYEMQIRILNRIRGEQPDTVRQQKQLAADICFSSAQEYDKQKAYEQAQERYQEGLKHCETHVKSMMALARIHLMRGDTDACQQQCVTLLRQDADNEEASMMLAELMFRKEHYETAIYHYQQLLEKKPTHYVALASLVQLLRRAGRLEEIPRYLKLAEKSGVRAQHDAGLFYCKGLHERYKNNLHDALRCFNHARKSGEWGSKAIFCMVEVYLNPDNEAVWEEATDAGRPTDNVEAVRAAEKLLKEVRGAKDSRHKILEAYAMMATKSKPDIEAALNMLTEIANVERESVPCLLAIATAFMMLKQTPKARNQLKRIHKMQYNAEEADEFERSWLLLADIHIQGGKFDLAQEMCKKCLKYNKSCAKAWEYLGQVMEREQAYKDASDHYENAWKFENEVSATVGYKLAFNYLKAKRYVEAIDVCHKVIQNFPQYPKIRKDVLDKARASLRP